MSGEGCLFRPQPDHFRLAEGYGWTVGTRSFDWQSFLSLKDVEIARLSGVYAANLVKAGADLIEDKARFVDPHTLELVGQGRRVTAAKILIATGGRPKLPEGLPGIEHAISSNEAFQLADLPKRIVLVGGGYIAVEFACIFHGLGVETTLVYRGTNILRGFDEDVRAHLADELHKRVVGQEDAVNAVADAIQRSRAGAFQNCTSLATLPFLPRCACAVPPRRNPLQQAASKV